MKNPFEKTNKKFWLKIGVLAFVGILGWVLFIVSFSGDNEDLDSSDTESTTQITFTSNTADIDYKNGVLKASLLEHSETYSSVIAKSGMTTNSVKARGPIDIKSCSDDEITLPASTALTSPDGLVYFTESAITLPPWKYDPNSFNYCPEVNGVEVWHVAAEPGPNYNYSMGAIGHGITVFYVYGSTKFSVAGYNTDIVWANPTSRPITIGSIEQVATTTNSDLIDAESDVTTKIDKEQLETRVNEKVQSADIRLSETLRFSEPTLETSANVVTAKVTVSLLGAPRIAMMEYLRDVTGDVNLSYLDIELVFVRMNPDNSAVYAVVI